MQIRFGILTFVIVPFLQCLPAVASAATLNPATSKAWKEYLASATARMERRLGANEKFLWIDEHPELLAQVRSGEIVSSPVGEHDPQRVPSGLIHDWIGVVFIDHARLQDVQHVLRDYSNYQDYYNPHVADSKTISIGDMDDRFSMCLMNKAVLLKTAFFADYQACYVQVDDSRAYGISRTTRVQEIQDYGSPSQHLLEPGQGTGIIWGLCAITRYAERDGGVYVELEGIGLSRDIPFSLRWLIDPLVRRVSRRALDTTLEDMERAVKNRAGLVANIRPNSRKLREPTPPSQSNY